MPIQFTHTVSYPSIWDIVPGICILLAVGLVCIWKRALLEQKRRRKSKISPFKRKLYILCFLYLLPLLILLIGMHIMSYDVLQCNNKLMIGFTVEGIYLHDNAINELAYLYIPWNQLSGLEHKIIDNRNRRNRRNRKGNTVTIGLTPETKHQIIVSFNSADLCLVSESSSHPFPDGSYELDIWKRDKYPEKSCILERCLTSGNVDTIIYYVKLMGKTQDIERKAMPF